MALVLANRVQETGTANTTVSFTLAGASTGFQSFAAIGNTNTTFYAATDAVGNWETGLGTYSTTGPTLTRTTVYASSNSGSAVTFSGTCNIFVTYPSGRSVNLDASGNVSALGTIASGVWNGSTIPTAYGGTGVTTSSGASSNVLRDANQNVTFNNYVANAAVVTAAAGTTVLTVGSARTQLLVGSTTQTFQLPDATTVALGQSFIFVNNSSGVLTVVNNASSTIETVPSGGITQMGATNIGTSAGTWGSYSFIPAAVDWGTNALNLASTVISGGTWQGGTIASGYGGTGLTTFAAANNALYSTSSSALAAGTLPVAAGGTGQTSYTDGQLLIGNTTGNTLTKTTLGASTGISVTNGSGAITLANTGVTSNVAGTGITVSGATGAVTISIGQAVATSSNVQFNSVGVGTAGSGTAGEIRATNNITAYYSDARLKTKVGNITDPLGKVRQIETMIYHANETAVELGYDASVVEVGVSAQSVQAVQPEAVAPAPIDDKYLTVRYERLVPLLLESVKALEDRIIELEAKLKG
jgi:hypothetical protein